MSVRLVVKAANIGRAVPATVTRTNMARVRNRPLTGALRRDPQGVLWQEIEDDDPLVDERVIQSDLFPPDRYTTWPPPHSPGCLVPITLPNPWHNGSAHHAHKVSDGIAHITPDRYVVVRIATHPDLTDPVAFVNFQLVAGAFTNPGQAHEADRKRLWDQGWAGARGIVNDLALRGVTTIWGADTNRPHCPEIHPRERRILTHGLDCLGYVEGSVAVRVRGKGTIPLDIDGHDGLFARLNLTSKEH